MTPLGFYPARLAAGFFSSAGRRLRGTGGSSITSGRRTAPSRQLLRDVFGVEPPPAEWKPEAWPDYAAPIVRMGAEGRRDSVLASFGLVPRSRIPQGVRPYDTMNARSETVGEKRTFSGSWKKGQLCLIAANAFEPRYDNAEKATRWRIGLASGEPFAIAGPWRAWPNGAVSFTLPTVNADRHPFLAQFHKPGDEKRSVVILPQEEWDDWLACRDPERARTFLRLQPPERLAGAPAPLPPRKKVAPALDASTPAQDSLEGISQG